MAWLLRSMLQVCGFMSGCCAPAFGCGASWLAVRLPPSGVVLHGWLLCSLLQVYGASWVAVVLPPPGGWGASRPPAAYCSQAPRQGHAPAPQCGGALA